MNMQPSYETLPNGDVIYRGKTIEAVQGEAAIYGRWRYGGKPYHHLVDAMKAINPSAIADRQRQLRS